jgi:hypothetical protein
MRGLFAASEAITGLHPLIQKAQRDALQSQLDELREQIAEYESLCSGQQAVISAVRLTPPKP